MGYTDKEMCAFTQVAYADLTEGYEYLCRKNPGKTSFTIAEVKKACLKAGVSEKKLAPLDYLTDKQMNDWRIGGIHDTNSTNGFVSCVIETSPVGKVPVDAAVGFRGSESMGDLGNMIHDWVEADLGLLNSTLTKQQAEVERMFTDPNIDWSKYGDLVMTGHSLGANLAEYATLISAKYGLDGKISRCVAYDGPGFSDEFIEAHRDEIARMALKMKHYRWSFVGDLLNDLPGVNYQYVQVTNEGQSTHYNVLTRHDPHYLKFDEDGYLMEGEQDGFASIMSNISKFADWLPAPIGDFLVAVLGGTMIAAIWVKELFFTEDGPTPAGWFLIGVAAGFGAALLISGGPVVWAIAAAVALVAIVFGEDILNFVSDVLNVVFDTVANILNLAGEVVSAIINGVVDILSKIGNFFNELFNAGARYVKDNTYIEVDTVLLRSCASNLRRIIKNARALDSKMDGLYGKLKVDLASIPELSRLAKANIIMKHIHTLESCAQYLEQTAEDFENVEKEIKVMIGG